MQYKIIFINTEGIILTIHECDSIILSNNNEDITTYGREGESKFIGAYPDRYFIFDQNSEDVKTLETLGEIDSPLPDKIRVLSLEKEQFKVKLPNEEIITLQDEYIQQLKAEIERLKGIS